MDVDRAEPALPPEPRGVRLSLQARLLVPVLLALIPAYLLLVANAIEEREASAQRARWRSFGVLSSTVAEMDRVVDSTSQLLQTLSEVPEVRRLDGQALKSLLADLVASRPGYSVEVTDASGRVVARAGPTEGTGPGQAPRTRPQMALEADGLLRASWPIRDGRSEVVGTVWAAASLAWVNRRAMASDLPEGSDLSLLDRRGVVIVHHPDPRQWVGRALPPDMLKPSEGQVRRGVEREGLDGVPRIYRATALRQVGGSPLGTLSVGIPVDAGQAEAEAALARNLALLTLVAVVSLAVAWLGGEWLLLRRLRVLSQTVRRLAHLDLTARTGLGHHHDEVGELAWSFDVMAERLERSRKREVSLLESAGEAICGVDETGRIVFANRAAEELLGLPARELPGRSLPGFLGRDGEAGAALSRTLRDRTRETAEEAELVRADGDAVPVEYTSAPMEEGAVVVLRDVTDRVRSRVEVEAAHRRVLHAAQEKKAFYREVLRSVTGGRFHLVDREAIPTEGAEVLDRALEADGYAVVRDELRAQAGAMGLTEEQTADLLVVFGEAASNAIKHGVEGRCQVFVAQDRVRVRVSDRGPGILLERLPATLFESGYSTRVSLGMGFTLMLQMADAVWLATSPGGTVLQVEKAVRPVLAEEELLQELMARF